MLDSNKVLQKSIIILPGPHLGYLLFNLNQLLIPFSPLT